MNKRKFNQVCALYKSGASEEVCINLIVEFSKGVNTGYWVAKFYRKVMSDETD